jgi:hypothetical protein
MSLKLLTTSKKCRKIPLSRSYATTTGLRHPHRAGFAHTRRKLTLDGLEADQAREEERAARVELERIQREISALQARLRSAVTNS